MDHQLRKVKSTAELNSRQIGASVLTPVRKVRPQDRTRPESPSVRKQLYTIKRPPSAAKVLDVSRRAASPFTTRPHSANAWASPIAARPASALSGRSQPAQTKNSRNTTVSVRIRPQTDNRTIQGWVVNPEDNNIRGVVEGSTSEYTFDHVFADCADNEMVYKTCVQKLVENVMEGFHGTVFAYGMTGTGKTYSMQGTSQAPGIITQSVHDLFRLIDLDHENRYELKVSYLEIYNERIRDLLNKHSDSSEEIRIREDPRRGTHAYPVQEVAVSSVTAFMETIAVGDLARHSAATDYNLHSSRSHAIIQIVVESEPTTIAATQTSSQLRLSTLSLIDLAGSERASTDVERRKEGAYINKSLLTLGTVISRLTSSGPLGTSTHIPFRDSKLTRLLQHALSGQSLISILATINLDTFNVTETTNTLKFASRAKFIPVKAKRAEAQDGDLRLLVESLRAEIFVLQSQLRNQAALTALHPNDDKATYTSRDVSTGHSSLDDIYEDGSHISTLQATISKLLQERAETDRYIQSLQSEILKLQRVDQNVNSSQHSPRSPPGNFSYPLGHSLRTPSQTIPTVASQTTEPDQNHDDDRDRVTADKELAASMLDKSQRSRAHARDLTNQIAHLKRREDKKSLASRLGINVLSKQILDNTADDTSDRSSIKLNGHLSHTLISPTIRAPREAGFF